MKKILIAMLLGLIGFTGFAQEPKVSINVARYKVIVIDTNNDVTRGIRFNTRNGEVAVFTCSKKKGGIFEVAPVYSKAEKILARDGDRNTWNGRMEIYATDRWWTYCVLDTFTGELFNVSIEASPQPRIEITRYTETPLK